MFIIIFFAFLNVTHAQNFCIKSSDKLKVFQSKIDLWQSALSENKSSFYPQITLTKNLILSFSEDKNNKLKRNNKVIKIKDHYCVEEIIFTSTLKDPELGQGFAKGTNIQLKNEDASIEYLPLFKTFYFSFLKKEFSIKTKLKGKSCSIQDIEGPLLLAGIKMNVIYPENNRECETYQKASPVEEKIDFESEINETEAEAEVQESEEQN